MQPSLGPLARHAARGHGVFTAADLGRLGIGRGTLRTMVRNGWCERVAPGVFRVAGSVRTPEQCLAIAVATHGIGAVISHRSAAWMWGIPGSSAQPAELTLPRHANQRGADAILHRSATLPVEHRLIRRGLPTTTAARTIFDLASVWHPANVERALDHSVNRGLCTINQVQHVAFVLGGRGREGTIVIRDLLSDRDGAFIAPASELESRARKLFHSHGIEIPAFEVDLGDAEWTGRVDCVWREAKLVVELDSRRFHGSPTGRDRDRRRDNLLMARGWRVLRITWEDLRDRPGETATLIAAALRAAAA